MRVISLVGFLVAGSIYLNIGTSWNSLNDTNTRVLETGWPFAHEETKSGMRLLNALACLCLCALLGWAYWILIKYMQDRNVSMDRKRGWLDWFICSNLVFIISVLIAKNITPISWTNQEFFGWPFISRQVTYEIKVKSGSLEVGLNAIAVEWNVSRLCLNLVICLTIVLIAWQSTKWLLSPAVCVKNVREA